MSPTSVGRSHRTPAKHELMNRLVGREVGAANHKPDVDNLVWFDLTAGDGVVPAGAEWEKNCSPGILAYHALRSDKPVTVHLAEKGRETYDALIEQLGEHLPRLGYWHMGDIGGRVIWGDPRTGSGAALIVEHSDGCEAKLDIVGSRTAMLVCHDPNGMHQRAMRDGFIAEARHRTHLVQVISTMGCNPAGLKRLPIEHRQSWFEFVDTQARGLPGHHDLTLAAIERDDAQWAYLICHAEKWSERVIADYQKSFNKHGMGMVYASRGSEPEKFRALQEHLFLTQKERDS